MAPSPKRSSPLPTLLCCALILFTWVTACLVTRRLIGTTVLLVAFPALILSASLLPPARRPLAWLALTTIVAITFWIFVFPVR